MSPENEGQNTLSILDIDLKIPENDKWLNMLSGSPPANEFVDHQSNGKVQNGTRNGCTTNGYSTNANGNINGLNGNARSNSGDVWSSLQHTDSLLPDPTTVLFNSSNNNEWKESEEINNIKNGRHRIHGNNNGSLMNGKNGHGLIEKYSEQDPLTGRYKAQIIPTRSDELSDDDGINNLPESDTVSNCGLFGFQPRWARSFASTHVFMVIFLLAWVLQGMYMTYFVSVITTIEKLFQIKSRTTGLLLSASEMGQISTAMLLTYFAGRGHRPRWIACGMVIFAIASFSCALPHFIFGKQLMQTNAFISEALNPLPNSVVRGGVSQQSLNPTELTSELGYTLSYMSSDHNLNLCLVSNNGTLNPASNCEDESYAH